MALWKQINGDWDTIEREGAPFDLLHSKPCLGVTQSPNWYPLVKYHVLAIILEKGKDRRKYNIWMKLYPLLWHRVCREVAPQDPVDFPPFHQLGLVFYQQDWAILLQKRRKKSEKNKMGNPIHINFAKCTTDLGVDWINNSENQTVPLQDS